MTRGSLALAMVLLCVLPVALGTRDGSTPKAEKISFWDTQRKGANQQNSRHRPDWFDAAGDVGIEFVRLCPDAWPSDERDFLIGDADEFREVNGRDLQVLLEALDDAYENDVKVVLTMLSLPGARWKQLNGGVDDGRLWREAAFQRQALDFWRQLASRLADHPAIVAYNPLNEPHPDREFGFDEPGEAFVRWKETAEGTPADLNAFSTRVVAAIREVDTETPIILDGWFYAAPQAFDHLEPIEDDKILYAFHNPGPWQMTTFRINKGRYSYPDRVPVSWDGPTETWTRDRLAREVDSVERFASRHGIPANRIIASEFWYDRRVPGAREYMADLISIYNERGWHWSFYAFRGDGSWTGLDYQLGTEGRMGQAYWEAVERGEDPEPMKKRHDNPLWEVLRREFAGVDDEPTPE